jgi:hypothetical protein
MTEIKPEWCCEHCRLAGPFVEALAHYLDTGHLVRALVDDERYALDYPDFQPEHRRLTGYTSSHDTQQA